MKMSYVNRKQLEIDLGTACLARAIRCRGLGDIDKAVEWAEHATSHFIKAGELIDNC